MSIKLLLLQLVICFTYDKLQIWSNIECPQMPLCILNLNSSQDQEKTDLFVIFDADHPSLVSVSAHRSQRRGPGPPGWTGLRPVCCKPPLSPRTGTEASRCGCGKRIWRRRATPRPLVSRWCCRAAGAPPRSRSLRRRAAPLEWAKSSRKECSRREVFNLCLIFGAPPAASKGRNKSLG